jgi:hypothetical protein
MVEPLPILSSLMSPFFGMHATLSALVKAASKDQTMLPQNPLKGNPKAT